jgi:hypothetical protein
MRLLTAISFLLLLVVAVTFQSSCNSKTTPTATNSVQTGSGTADNRPIYWEK